MPDPPTTTAATVPSVDKRTGRAEYLCVLRRHGTLMWERACGLDHHWAKRGARRCASRMAKYLNKREQRRRERLAHA